MIYSIRNFVPVVLSLFLLITACTNDFIVPDSAASYSLVRVEVSTNFLYSGGKYNFSNIITNTSSITQQFVLHNNGRTNLLIEDLSINDTNGAFFLTPLNITSIPAGGSAIFGVYFSPTNKGIKNASLSLSNNSLSNNAFVVNLKGRGTGQGSLSSCKNIIDTTYLKGACDLVISEDERFLYVAARNSDAVCWFSRNSETGELAMMGHITAPYLDVARSVAISPA